MLISPATNEIVEISVLPRQYIKHNLVMQASVSVIDSITEKVEFSYK